MSKKIQFSQYQIKFFMAILMVTDHLNHVPGLIPNNLVLVFHVLTRCVGAWFAYTAVEGFLYTHNLKKYIVRLYGSALLMLVGNKLLEFIYASKSISISNNIFLTLAIGVTMLAALKNIRQKLLAWIAVIVLFFAGVYIGEGALVLLPFMVITYYTYDKPKRRNIGYAVLSIALFAISLVIYEDVVTTISMLAINSEFMFVLVLPFLYLYNGEHGPNSKFSKYFFYVFYPAHLWLLATIAYFVS